MKLTGFWMKSRCTEMFSSNTTTTKLIWPAPLLTKESFIFWEALTSQIGKFYDGQRMLNST